MTVWIVFSAVVWWTFAVMVFAFMTYERADRKEAISSAVFWPFWCLISLPVMLWRLPFKTAKAIRIDLRNRKLLKQFDSWLATQKEGDD